MDNNDNNNGNNANNNDGGKIKKGSEKSIFRNTGNYEKLWTYQKSEALFDITFFFTKRFLSSKDRTVGQMMQAARSGKQNIIEGCKASATSAKTEIFLIRVAQASLFELKGDYLDYLRVRAYEDPVKWRTWEENSIEAKTMYQLSCKHNDAAFYMKIVMTRPPETIANIAIRLLVHTDKLLNNQLATLEKTFLEEGGFSERMTRLRIEERNRQKEEERKRLMEERNRQMEERYRQMDEEKKRKEKEEKERKEKGEKERKEKGEKERKEKEEKERKEKEEKERKDKGQK